MSEPLFTFLTKEEVLNLHVKVIEAFGGSHGLRDDGALESALFAAENRFHYENAKLAICAATYAFHLTQAHAFVDGNKRIADVVAALFLKLNNAEIVASSDELIELFLKIAASEMTREEVEAFFVEHTKLKAEI